MSMNVSIVIVNYNTKELTLNCLTSIVSKTTGLKYEIIVVDNASTDSSCEEIKQNFSETILIENNDNLGFARANNIATRVSNGKYVFFLNSDTVLLNNAIKIFFDFMESQQGNDFACCGGNLFEENMEPQLPFGNFPSLRQIFFEQFFLYRIFPKLYANIPNLGVKEVVSELKEVPYVSGADLFIRKEVLDIVGNFDERFFLYYEDTDLGYRLKQAGHKSAIIPDAKIIHLVGGSSKPSMIKFRIQKKSEFMFFRKNYGRMKTVVAKLLYITGCLVRVFTKRDLQQIKYARIILQL
jgi:GT2 family glycosyltransferase